MKERLFQAKLEETVEAFVGRARDEFEYRLKKWPPDLSHNDVREVIGALLARQVTLAVQLASSLSNWNGHIAPLFLRTMADVYINVAWVLRDPDDRAKKFILYGLGQAKLELEHRRADLATREPKRGEIERNQIQEDWINRQRATFLTDVNLGSWSGISTRTMADEAGCIDFYNYVYTPFSSCTHSTWHHVAMYNLSPCNNPLHRYHFGTRYHRRAARPPLPASRRPIFTEDVR
jgi:Family of unknown function (DUF5677)